MLLNEVVLRQVQEPGQFGNFLLRKSHLTGPPTTSSTPLAFNFDQNLMIIHAASISNLGQLINPSLSC
jgi:hypothetical protein